jgi:Tfp pilus assembly protein PilV
MNKINNNQKGFTIVEALLIILILAVIGFGGYYVYHTNNKTKSASASTTAAKTSTANSTKSTVATAANPYSGWKTYTTKYEKITFQYPSNWTLKDNSLTMAEVNDDMAPVNCTLNSGTDVVLLTSPSGSTLGMATGQECHSGAQEGTYVGFTPISVLGGSDYIAYETSPTDSSSVIAATISTSSTVGYDYPASKNITGSSNPWNQFTYTPTGTINPNQGEPLSTFESNPNLATSKLILESFKYN